MLGLRDKRALTQLLVILLSLLHLSIQRVLSMFPDLFLQRKRSHLDDLAYSAFSLVSKSLGCNDIQLYTHLQHLHCL